MIYTRPVAILAPQFKQIMGKGDKRSKKGKIWKGSYGVSRSKKAIKARLKRVNSRPAAASPAATEEKPKAKRAPRKKEASAE